MSVDNLDRSAIGRSFLKKEINIASSLLRSFDTPRSLTVHLLLKYSEWSQLLDLSINPSNYTEEMIQKFSYDYQATSLFQKNPRLPTGTPRKMAVRKWVESERLCRSTNERLRPIVEGKTPNPMYTQINRMREYLVRVLPRLSSDVLHRIEDGFAFGPGRTTHAKGRNVSRSHKYKSRTFGCTPSLADYFVFGWPHMWKYTDREIDIQPYNLVDFVPKNAKTDRAIAYEPDLNIFVQKGIGSFIKDRLRRLGIVIDKNSGGGRKNRAMARQGSLTGDLATIDLSSASDTISLETVRLLVPSDWFLLLSTCRSEFSKIRGSKVLLSKFSSMGNGFTFELETAIFAAACYAVSNQDFTVYGDDIVIASDCVDSLIELLEFLGFKVNEQKSFFTGAFRESCGEDFFFGELVRPFFLRKSLNDSTENEIFYVMANRLSRVSGNLYDHQLRDIRYFPAWLRCYTGVERTFRRQIPYGYSDDGFHFCKHDPVRRSQANIFRYWSRSARTVRRDELGGLVSALHRGVPPEPSINEDLRSRFPTATLRTGRVFTWPYLGPWV